MTSTVQHSFLVHDLLLLRSVIASSADGRKPEWVTSPLGLGHFWAVVRRASAPDGSIAVGVRGVNRSQRWGGFAALADVKERLRPSQLFFHMAHRTRIAIPALATLSWLEGQLGKSELDWGPVGSVGFELATGQQVVTAASDLDIALFASNRFTKDAARDLWSVMRGAPAKVDVRIETPYCGFSLEEYAREPTEQVLVRLPESRRFAIDPWSVSIIKDEA